MSHTLYNRSSLCTRAPCYEKLIGGGKEGEGGEGQRRRVGEKGRRGEGGQLCDGTISRLLPLIGRVPIEDAAEGTQATEGN